MRPYIAIPATIALVYRAWSRRSLTPAGIAVAAITAIIHAIHPWSIFFALLVVFFLTGTAVTKIKHDVKSRLTISASGSPGGEGARTHIQVLANSATASILILVHYIQLSRTRGIDSGDKCWDCSTGSLLVAGIISNYAAVAADTFSSELGILSSSTPRLLTSLNFRPVPRGTNGGITLLGTAAGFLGASIIGLVTAILLPICPSNSPYSQRFLILTLTTIWGGIGSLFDSFLGGIFQASVIDRKTGKIVEGRGGVHVLYTPSLSADSRKGTMKSTSGTQSNPKRSMTENKRAPGSRILESGRGILNNNGVNFVMALGMSLGGMLVVYMLRH